MSRATFVLREARRAAGLSQRELARRAGTSSATLSRYESGAISPTVSTLDRLLRACLPRRRRWASLRELGPALAERLAEEGSRAAWRLVGEFLDDSNAADVRELVLSSRERPDETGDPRVDAVLASLAEHLCAERGLAPPGWTQESRECVPWWFVADHPGFVATALRESPMSFSRRGIFITAGALERT
jgi:transcriptional regulator with XRE-family HTH domain